MNPKPDPKPDPNPTDSEFSNHVQNLLRPPNLNLTPKQEAAPKAVTAKKLDELDLDKELLEQYIQATQLREDVKDDEAIPINQKAQLMNTISGILQSIIKSQQELHSIERMKLIENTLIEVLKNHENLKEAFLADYEKALENLK